jgi:hypothetical protein
MYFENPGQSIWLVLLAVPLVLGVIDFARTGAKRS